MHHATGHAIGLNDPGSRLPACFLDEHSSAMMRVTKRPTRRQLAATTITTAPVVAPLGSGVVGPLPVQEVGV